MNKDRETAKKYLQQALEGDLMAMNNMGVCFAQGIGVVEQDYKKALHWYLIAADKGDTQSQVNAANAYYLGQGCEEDHAKAHELWLRAAQKGHLQSQKNVGVNYWNGLEVDTQSHGARI